MNEMNSTVTQSHPSNSFQRLFWEQQLQAVRTRDNQQVRWHPAMIKWCLNCADFTIRTDIKGLYTLDLG